MTKILFLIQLPPPIHGASVMNNLLKESGLLSAAFESAFIDLSPADDFGDIGRVSIRKIWKTIKIYIRSMQKFFGHHPDLVYMTLSPTGAALYKDAALAILLKWAGARLVFHMHGKGIRKASLSSPIKKWIYTIALKNSDIIHLSQSFYGDVSAFVEPDNFHVVRNGIESLDQSPTKQDKPIKILYLSNFVREKGPLILLEACHLLKERNDEFDITFSGKFFDKQLQNDFERKISDLKISNVFVFHGSYGIAKQQLLNESHIMILPTSSDCFPLVLLEAMANSMAVISTYEGAIPEIVDDNKTGILIENCTPQALANAIASLLDSPRMMCEMAQNGHQKFHHQFTARNFEENLLKTLTKIAGKAKAEKV